jgi:methionyl-tRNA formyltransferase
MQMGLDFTIQPRNDSPLQSDFVDAVSSFRPDWIFCSSYSLRIPKTILVAARFGAVNFHGGLLPEWRGANILNWVLIEGCSTTGVTAHWMTSEFDDGHIISKQTVKIDDEDTACTLADKLRFVAQRMFLEILQDVKSEVPLAAIPQDTNRVRYFRRRRPEDGFIDWRKSDLEIYNLIRALVHPWPGAFTVLPNGERVFFKDLVPLSHISKLRQR